MPSRLPESPYLDRDPGRVSVPQQLVSRDLDTVHPLLPELQIPHQPLTRQATTISVTLVLRSAVGSPRRPYRVVVLLGRHVGVALAPVVVDLLFLFVVQPHQLFGGRGDEGVQLVQVVQTGLGGALQRGG